jgi:glycerol kinase
MLPQQRKDKILDILPENGFAKAINPVKLFKVNEVIIRRDLEKLEKEGLLLRERGGAYLKNIEDQVRSFSLSNKRETFIVWEKSGKASAPALVWQCKRSIAICEDLNSKRGISEEERNKTRLIIDPYFSGTELI